MDLSVSSVENMQLMIDEICQKLKMASGSMMKPEHFDMKHYNQMRDIHSMIMNKDNISISEMEAIATEIGKMRVTT